VRSTVDDRLVQPHSSAAAGGVGLRRKVVVDVRPDSLFDVTDHAKFGATAKLCRMHGWEYRRVGEPPGSFDDRVYLRMDASKRLKDMAVKRAG
jgi:hypothetical protein